jgi:hypothetical protein
MGSSEGSRLRRLRVELDRSLFPAASPETLRVQGWEGAVLAIGFLALAGALQFFRAGPTASAKALFAEDGPVYLGGALMHGFFDSLVTPYAEYLVVIPRFLGEVATIPPLRYAPETMNVEAVLLVAASGLAVWVASAGLIRNTYLRALLVALVLVPPAGGLETVVSATNVAWYTSFAVFWLLLWRPAANWSAGLGALLILTTGLSSPTIFFFVPLAALRAVAIRDRRDGLLVGAFALALTIQLPVTASSTEQVAEPLWTGNVFTVFLQRVIDGSALGLELGGEAWAAWGWPFLMLISLAVAVALVALAVRATSGRLFALVAIVTAVAMFLASVYQRALGDVMVWPVGTFDTLGGRYAIIPALLLASAAIVLVDSRLRGSRSSRWPAIALGLAMAVALVTSFGGNAHREMPSWHASLIAGATECREQAVAEATVFISPEGWTMTIPCERLESEYEAAPAG